MCTASKGCWLVTNLLFSNALRLTGGGSGLCPVVKTGVDYSYSCDEFISVGHFCDGSDICTCESLESLYQYDFDTMLLKLFKVQSRYIGMMLSSMLLYKLFKVKSRYTSSMILIPNGEGIFCFSI